MRYTVVQVTFLSSLLAACGGGGGETLTVDFDYDGTALLWRPTFIPLRAAGLNGKTPNCTIVSGSLPAGLAITTQGCAVSGTPVEAVVSLPTISLSVPGYSGHVEKQVKFEVLGPPLTYGLPLSGRPGTPLSALPNSLATGPVGPWTPGFEETVTYSVASGALPGGLRLDSATGKISGILTTPSSDEFVIAATVAGPNGSTIAYSQRNLLFTSLDGLAFFYGPNDSPVDIPLGQSISLTPLFNFGVYLDSSEYSYGTYRLRSTSRPLPPGLDLNSTTGQLSGTPLVAGRYELQFEVELSSQGQSAAYPSSTLVLTIVPQ